MSTILNQNLPDVANESPAFHYPSIDWVGMDSIEIPIVVRQAGEGFRIPARVDAKVSLDKKDSRGIHMSRLYLIVQEELSRNELSLRQLGEISSLFLKTHADLSSRAQVSVAFEMPLLRPALKSQNKAWRNYPVRLAAIRFGNEINYFVETQIIYSSTCPASAALARQLIQNHFKNCFSGKELQFDEIHDWLGTSKGIIATPHAQRSFARVKAQVTQDFDFSALIDLIEDELATAVQGAVKREDEQEFALRNGQNLMFCEDASRKVKAALEREKSILDYVAELNHAESLHPHNAVALVSKGHGLNSF